MAYQKIYFKVLFLSLVVSNEALSLENFGAYIPPMCYTKTEQDGQITNPCYVCHTNGKEPNYFNELTLQQNYLFPKKMMDNPYKNLFVDRRSQIAQISDRSILEYIRVSNYDKDLQAEYGCYFHFDEEGFDRDSSGAYTLWRAFGYKPFMGTFFPTNGSMDDVIVRLPKIFTQSKEGHFSLAIYKQNLDVVLHNIKANKNTSKKNYKGKAAKIQADLGLYPVGTEFLHTVRYIDFNSGEAIGSKRFKELRYGKKVAYKSYWELERLAEKEFFEEPDQHGLPSMQSYIYDAQKGFDNEMGWYYKGYIEDKDGALRVQTDEETLSCIGCHAKLGATTDSTFALPRQVEWGYQSLDGIKDENDEYKNYLLQNPTGNEYGTNDEVFEKFFHADGSPKKDRFVELSKDIKVLLIPTYKRAMQLNKAYYLLVQDQSYIFAKEATIEPIKNVHESIQEIDTGIKRIIINNNIE